MYYNDDFWYICIIRYLSNWLFIMLLGYIGIYVYDWLIVGYDNFIGLLKMLLLCSFEWINVYFMIISRLLFNKIIFFYILMV